MIPLEPITILSIQPRPFQTLRAALTSQDGTRYTVLVRRWSTNEAGRCRLCRLCTAKVGADRQAICIVATTGEVSEVDSPLYRNHDG